MSIKDLWNSAKDYVTGDSKTEFKDVPEFSVLPYAGVLHSKGVDVKNLLKVYGSSLLSNNPDDTYAVMSEATKGLDGIEFAKDKHDNVMMFVDGNPYYLNKPGLSMNDIVPFLADAATLAVAPEALPLKLAGKGITSGIGKLAGETAGKFVSKGAGYSGYEAAKTAAENELQGKEDTLSSRDLAGSLLQGGVAGALDLAVPGILKGAINGVKGRLSKEVPDEVLSNAPEYIQEAYRRGGEDKKIAKALLNGDLPNEAGIPLTAGQLNQDNKLIRLENKANTDKATDKAQDLASSFNDIQSGAIDNKLLDINRNFNKDASLDANSLNNAGDLIQDSFKTQKNLANQDVKDAYSKVDLSNVLLPQDNSLHEVVENSIDKNLINSILDINPTYSKDINAIKGAIPNIKTASDIDNLKKNIDARVNSLISANPSLDKTKDPGIRAYSILRSNLDNYINDLADKGILQGDLSNITALRNAKDTYKDYANKFEFSRNNQGGDSLLKQLNNDNTTPENILDLITKGTAASSSKAVGAIKQLKNVFGEGSNELNAIKEHYLLKMFTNAVDDNGALKVNTKNALDNYNKFFAKNNSVTKELFKEEELAQIKSFVDSLKKVQNAKTIKAKKSADNLPQLLALASHKIPFLGSVIEHVLPADNSYQTLRKSLGLDKEVLPNNKWVKGLARALNNNVSSFIN